MHLRILILTLVSVCAVRASAKENAWEEWIETYSRSDHNAPALIAVAATLRTHDGGHFLAFRFTNISKHSVYIEPFCLPWNGPSVGRVTAFTTDGKRLQNLYPLLDPSYEGLITVAPGQTLRGERLLGADVADIDKPRKRDTIVLWNYQPLIYPTRRYNVSSHTALCTGVVVIPRLQ